MSQISLPNIDFPSKPKSGQRFRGYSLKYRPCKLNTNCQHHFLIGLLNLPDRGYRLYPTPRNKTDFTLSLQAVLYVTWICRWEKKLFFYLILLLKCRNVSFTLLTHDFHWIPNPRGGMSQTIFCCCIYKLSICFKLKMSVVELF